MIELLTAVLWFVLGISTTMVVLDIKNAREHRRILNRLKDKNPQSIEFFGTAEEAEEFFRKFRETNEKGKKPNEPK